MHLSEAASKLQSIVPPAPGLHQRLVSVLALCATVAAIGYAARGGYLAATDSWVVPINLSPDNDMVVQANIALNERLVDRSKMSSDVERIDAEVKGVNSSIGRLEPLRASGDQAVRWTEQVTHEEQSALGAKLRSLRLQRALLEDMSRRQRALVDTAARNVAQGLAAEQDHAREVQVLSQMRLTMAETERDTGDALHQTQALRQVAVALDAARSGQAGGMLPELADHEEREARIEVEVIKLEAEKRSLLVEKAIDLESLSKIDEIVAQLSRRPLYRAIQASTDVAFVPYSQLKGVQAGADLVDCTLLIFRCKRVGRVAEVLPGEVVTQDPWSNMARGQYAILDLTDHDAAHEKVLRVRWHSSL